MFVLPSVCSLARSIRPSRKKQFLGGGVSAHHPWPPPPPPVLELRDSWGIVIELEAGLEDEPTELAAANDAEDPAEEAEAPAAGFDPE